MALLAQVSTQKLLTRHIQGYGSVDIFDEYTKPGFITLGAVTFNTSSTSESYTLANNPFLTGNVSTLGLIRVDADQSVFEAGSFYLSSLYFGNLGGTVAGQLTTDATATDLFWNGSKLNDQSGGGGGGISVSELTSTTIGLGTIGYISTAGGGISISELTSTVTGLGSIGYISTPGGGGGGGAIDYVSAFTVSTGALEVSSISTYSIYSYGIITTQLFNVGPDPLGITTIPSGTLTSLSDWSITSGYSTTVDAVTSLYLSSSNDIRFVAPTGLYVDAPQVTMSNLFVNEGVSTYSMTIYGPSTLTVQGWSFFENVVSSPTLITNTVGFIDSVSGEPSYIQAYNGSLEFNGTVLPTQSLFISTIDGLGTLGYISTPGLTTIPSYVSTDSIYTSSLLASSMVVSSLTVDSLIFGDGNGWAYFGAIQAVVVSTIQMDTGAMYASTIQAEYFIGDGSLLSNVGMNVDQLVSTVVGVELYTDTALISSITGVDTALISSMTGNDTALISSIAGIQFYSDTALVSSVAGLEIYTDTAISSFSTALGAVGGGGIASLPLYLSSESIYTSSLLASSMVVSSLTVDSLIFGDGNGWAYFGAIQAVVVSTVQSDSALSYVSSIQADSISTTSIQSYTLSSLQTLASSVQANYFIGDGSLLTNITGGGGSGGSIDYVSAFTVSTGVLEVSSISGLANGAARVAFPVSLQFLAGAGTGSESLYYTQDFFGTLTGIGGSVLNNGSWDIQWVGSNWIAGGIPDANGYNMYTSVDGTVWNPVVSNGLNDYTVSFYYDPLTTLLVALGYGTSGATYEVSVNGGTSWSLPLDQPAFYPALAIATNGSQWIMGGILNTTYTMVSGPSIIGPWTPFDTSIFDNYVSGIAYGKGVWVAVGASTNTLAYSLDGSNWIGLGTSIFDTTGSSVVFNGSIFVAGGNGTTNTLAYSYDGINWVGLGLQGFTSVSRVVWDTTDWSSVGSPGPMFWAMGVGGANLGYSTDGITWIAGGFGEYSEIRGYGYRALGSQKAPRLEVFGGTTTESLTVFGTALIQQGLNIQSSNNPDPVLTVNTVERMVTMGANVFISEGLTTSSIQCLGTISTHSLVIYGPSTLTVQGLSYFQNTVSSANIITNSLGVIDSVTGQPSYIQTSNGSFDFNGASVLDQAILTSTIKGLGTLGYISTAGVSQIIAGTNVTINPIGGTGVVTINASGGGGGPSGPVPYLSSFNLSTGYVLNPLQVGTNSTESHLGFYGTTGNYTQSVVGELDTGGGSQELLFFRGSNALDRIRMQTTGNIVFESGVSSRVWPSAPSNATPAMVIDIASNVGIKTASPTTALDVAGTGRFASLSTTNTYTGAFFMGLFFA